MYIGLQMGESNIRDITEAWRNEPRKFESKDQCFKKET